MDAVTPKSRGEKWVLFMGQYASGKWGIWVGLGIALLEGYSFLTTGNTSHLSLVVVWLLVALVYFERQHYYRIIQKQQAQLKSYQQKSEHTLTA